MKTITEYIGQQLELVNTNFWKSNYELKFNNTALMSLRSVDFWSKIHEVTGFEKTWIISRPSVWKSKIEIREQKSEMVVATIEGKAFNRNSEIIFSRGEKLILKTGIWKSGYELQNEFGNPVAAFKNKKWYSSDQIVELKQKSELLDKYPFVIMLAFLIVLQQRHAAATAA